MTQVATRQSAAFSGPALLPLKLAPPAARSESLLRPDLQALLAEVRLRPATLVIAPAGYGKTTLLTQWAAELQRTGANVSWLGLDAEDQDPSLLLAYLVRSFQRHQPEVGEEAWRILHSAADLHRDVVQALAARHPQGLRAREFSRQQVGQHPRSVVRVGGIGQVLEVHHRERIA